MNALSDIMHAHPLVTAVLVMVAVIGLVRLVLRLAIIAVVLIAIATFGGTFMGIVRGFL